MSLISARRTSGPAVSLHVAADLRQHIRHIGDISDPEAERFLAVGEAYLDGPEGQLRRALVHQVWEWKFEGAPGLVWLPLAPVAEVQEIAGADAVEVIRGDWLRITGASDLVTITALCGYGPAASDVPAPLRHAALLIAAQQDEARSALGDVSEAFAGAREASYSVKSLIGPYVRRSI